MIDNSILQCLWLGIIHMITGYGQVGFFLLLLLYVNRFRELLKLILIFIISHSATLIASIIFQLPVNYYQANVLVGFTVLYMSFANLDGFTRFLKIKAPPIMPIILLAGILHGLAFSQPLRQLSAGVYSLKKMLFFNVGLEAGILLLFILWPVLVPIRNFKYWKRLRLSFAALIIVVGLPIVLNQAYWALAYFDRSPNYGFENGLQGWKFLRNARLSKESKVGQYSASITNAIPCWKGIQKEIFLPTAAAKLTLGVWIRTQNLAKNTKQYEGGRVSIHFFPKRW